MKAHSRPRIGPVLNDDVVQINCLKSAEDADDPIVRLFEPIGQAQSTVLSIPFIGLRTRANLVPFETKASRVSGETRRITEVDLLENATGGTNLWSGLEAAFVDGLHRRDGRQPGYRCATIGAIRGMRPR